MSYNKKLLQLKNSKIENIQIVKIKTTESNVVTTTITKIK